MIFKNDIDQFDKSSINYRKLFNFLINRKLVTQPINFDFRSVEGQFRKNIEHE